MKHVFATLLLAFLFTSCKHEYPNTNPVFDKYPPEANEYKAELARQLNKPDLVHLTYYVDSYAKEGEKEYMYVDVEAKSINATAILDITNAEALEQFRKVKGVSYHGAELSGLVYTIDSTGGTYNFVFKDLVGISD